MRNLKKFLALVLAMMMAFSLMVTANAMNPNYDYPDVEEATFDEAIDVLTGMGVFRGDNGNFYPTRPIMRSEAVAILYRLVTGDVSDSQAQLYAPAAAQFNDVLPNAWYAGYVGFAVDAGFVKGYNGDFMPNQNVTGYEMLAMLLRAVGYGKNGEFTGSQWMVNVGSTAQSLGILTNIQSTHYANTLSRASTREVVAELTFETAAYVPTVRYEYGYYNQYTGVAIAQGDNELNPTLGKKVYGLTGQTGIIVGNQATGEDYTLLGVSFKYGATDNGIVYLNTNGSYLYDDSGSSFAANGDGYATWAFDAETGLKLFGHKATVWDNGYGHAYAVIDRATMAEYVYSEDNDLANDLGDAAKAEGFKLTNAKTAHFSDRYCQMSALSGVEASNESPISTYALISNNNNKTVDVVIALSAEVAQITQKNTTAKDPYVVLGYSNVPNASTFGDGTTAGKILVKQLTADSVQDLGKVVTAYEIVGTTDKDGNDRGLTEAAGIDTNGGEDVMYQLENMKSFTATVSSYKLGVGGTVVDVDTATTEGNSDVISVSLVGRSDPMLLSGIVKGDDTNSEIISQVLPVIESLRANTTYTVYEDIVGRFISLVTDSPYTFLYGTYADFQVGGLGTGTIGYNMVGVNWDGEKLGENTLNSRNNAPITGALYNELTVTRKDYGAATGNSSDGNELNGGYYTGYLYNATTGDLQDYAGNRMSNGDSWSIKSSDASNGFVKVTSGGDDYLLTRDTQFIVVSGTGTATLKVDMYKGLADFLQGAAEAVVNYNSAVDAPNNDQVIFVTEAEEYGTVDTNNNGVVSKVIMSVDNLNRWNSTTMYFNFNTTAETGMVLPGTNTDNVKQYALWCNGELGYYFVDSTIAGGVAPTDAMNFYNLVKTYEVGGVPVYKAVKAGTGDLTGSGYACNNATYEYITVSTLDTGLFKDDVTTGGKVFSIANAKVCDVQSKTGGAPGRNEITTLRELNNAVSVRQPDGSTAVYGIGVAIVYDGINVATIYVTSVAG